MYVCSYSYNINIFPPLFLICKCCITFLHVYACVLMLLCNCNYCCRCRNCYYGSLLLPLSLMSLLLLLPGKSSHLIFDIWMTACRVQDLLSENVMSFIQSVSQPVSHSLRQPNFKRITAICISHACTPSITHTHTITHTYVCMHWLIEIM